MTADCFHLNAKARETVAGNIKEQIVGWLRGKKRGSDTSLGGDSKRLKLDAAGGGGRSGVVAAATGPSRKGDGKVRANQAAKVANEGHENVTVDPCFSNRKKI
jgi:hypothetical protein